MEIQRGRALSKIAREGTGVRCSAFLALQPDQHRATASSDLIAGEGGSAMLTLRLISDDGNYQPEASKD